MCGYDPFYWYDWELDRQYEAFEHGFDNYEDYYNSIQAELDNDIFDRLHDEQKKKGLKNEYKLFNATRNSNNDSYADKCRSGS